MEWTVAVTEPAPALALDLRCPKLQGSGQVSAIGFQRGSAAEALKRLPIFLRGGEMTGGLGAISDPTGGSSRWGGRTKRLVREFV